MKLGFIGTGNMASAIILGAVNNSLLDASDIYLYDVNSQAAEAVLNQINANNCSDIEELCLASDIIFLCVKPNVMPEVLSEVSKYINNNKSVVSIAAGYSFEKLQKNLPDGTQILRIMPNTPLLVGFGMTVFEKPNTIPEEHYRFAYNIFSKLGRCIEQGSKNMDAVTALSGSGPAFVYMFIDAMKQAGVYEGLSERDALLLAAQTVYGGAAMVLNNNIHPEELVSMVCSPGGTTIEGVASLQKNGFKGIIMEAASDSADKSKFMNKL